MPSSLHVAGDHGHDDLGKVGLQLIRLDHEKALPERAAVLQIVA
jgi:hypothetical protein